MFAAASAAKASLEMIVGSEDHQSLVINIIVFRSQSGQRLLFWFHGLAERHFLYLGLILFRISAQK